MLEFLKKRCQTLEHIEARSADKTEKSNKEGDQRDKTFSAIGTKLHFLAKGAANQRTTALATSLSSGKCYLCNGAHFIYFCEKFLTLPVSDRIKEVRRLKLCLNCLKNVHYVKTCKMGICRECTGKHNTLCHQSQGSKISSKTDISESQDEVNNDQSLSIVAIHHASSNVKKL